MTERTATRRDGNSAGRDGDDSSRRAEIETSHADAATAEVVAAALRPDNTESMTTTVDGDVVRTVIERETTGGLGSSMDDYVVNASVAETVIRDIYQSEP